MTNRENTVEWMSDPWGQVTTIVAILFPVAIASIWSRKGIRKATESAERSERRNKEMILKDHMITAMSNIMALFSELKSNEQKNNSESFNGGMYVVHPVDVCEGGDMGIIAEWAIGQTSGGLDVFHFAYLIFHGNRKDRRSIILEDFKVYDGAVAVKLLRTSDGKYTLDDAPAILSSIEDYNVCARTSHLDDKKFNYLMAILHLLAICDKETLAEHRKMYQDIAKYKNEESRLVIPMDDPDAYRKACLGAIKRGKRRRLEENENLDKKKKELEEYEQSLLRRSYTPMSKDEFHQRATRAIFEIKRFIKRRNIRHDVIPYINYSYDDSGNLISVKGRIKIIPASAVPKEIDADIRLLVSRLTGELSESPIGGEVEWSYSYRCWMEYTKLTGERKLIVWREWNQDWDEILGNMGNTTQAIGFP